MRILPLVVALLTLPILSHAGICEKVWSGDGLMSTFSGRPEQTRISLKDQNQTVVAEVSLHQVTAFHEAKTRISKAVGLSPVFVICADRDPNAFAIPSKNGDVIAITVGMLKTIDGDRDEAAYIVGHEVAHHTRKHGVARQERTAVIELLAELAGSAVEKKTSKRYGPGLGYDIASVGGQLIGAKYTRDQEREADQIGLQYMAFSGYNPKAAIRTAGKFAAMGMGGSGLFLDTHPGWSERAKQLSAMIENDSMLQASAANEGSGDPMEIPSPSIDPGTILATVNGRIIPKYRADAMVSAQLAQGKQDSPDLRNAAKEEIVRREVLAQEAMKAGVDKRAEVQGQIDLARQGVLIGAYLNDYAKRHSASDKAQTQKKIQQHIADLRAAAKVE